MVAVMMTIQGKSESRNYKDGRRKTTGLVHHLVGVAGTVYCVVNLFKYDFLWINKQLKIMVDIHRFIFQLTVEISTF